MLLCSKPRGARGIEPETFGGRGQLLSRPPTTVPDFSCYSDAEDAVAHGCLGLVCYTEKASPSRHRPEPGSGVMFDLVLLNLGCCIALTAGSGKALDYPVVVAKECPAVESSWAKGTTSVGNE